MAHNHPSGDLTPSALDLEATRNAIAAGRMLGIRVVDHLIIGEGQMYSMRAQHPDMDWTKKALDKTA
jgi:DNA repair protein RadC